MSARAIVGALLVASPLACSCAGLASSLIPQIPSLNSFNSLSSLGLPGLNQLDNLGLNQLTGGLNIPQLNSLSNLDLSQITSGGLGSLSRSAESIVPDIPVLGSISNLTNGANLSSITNQIPDLSSISNLSGNLSDITGTLSSLPSVLPIQEIPGLNTLTRSAENLQIPGLSNLTGLASQLTTLPSFAAAETDLLREMSTTQPQMVTKIVQDMAKNIPGISALTDDDASVFTDLMKDVVVVPAALGAEPLRAIGEATQFLGLK